ncbi:PTS transporter subunit EIIB [Vibrio lentus]|nr:PTS transporter subunit EIIB [Vibrio lentus]
MVEKSDAVVLITPKSSSKKKNFKENMQLLVTALSGEDNIVSITHCMTRLRFKLADESLLNEKTIKQIADVKVWYFNKVKLKSSSVLVEKWFNTRYQRLNKLT